MSVTYIRCLSNKLWSFLLLLMIGYSCRMTVAELTVDFGEIARKQWFSRVELAAPVAHAAVKLSPRLSIARDLIEY